MNAQQIQNDVVISDGTIGYEVSSRTPIPADWTYADLVADFMRGYDCGDSVHEVEVVIRDADGDVLYEATARPEPKALSMLDYVG